MNANEEYAIELLLGGHLGGREIGNGYITAYMYECHITNPERLDRWLLNNGYLRSPTIEESLSRYKVPESKNFLSQKGMKTTGKKAVLIERLASVLSDYDIKVLFDSDNRYYLSEKGLKHYYANIDLEELHRNWKYCIPLQEYFKYRKSNTVVRNFYEIAYLIIQKRTETGELGAYNQNRLTSSDFRNFSEICEKLGMYSDAMKAILMKLLIDTNLAVNIPSYFDRDYIEMTDINCICDRIDQNQCAIFNLHTIQKIVSLSEFYSEYMVDEIYENNKLQYILFDKRSFKLAIEDMLQSAYFECTPYMKIIKDNYRKTVRHLLYGRNSSGFTNILHFFRK